MNDWCSCLSWGINWNQSVKMQISLVSILNANIYLVGMAIATSMEYEAYKCIISGYSYSIMLISKSGFCCPYTYTPQLSISNSLKITTHFQKLWKCHLYCTKTKDLQILPTSENKTKQNKTLEYLWNRKHYQKHFHKRTLRRVLSKIYIIKVILFKYSIMATLLILNFNWEFS